MSKESASNDVVETLRPGGLDKKGLNRGARTIRGAVVPGMVLLFCGCASTHAASGNRPAPSSTMPDVLTGAWHSNDHQGRESCEAYKKIESASDITEETSGLIGGLMITKHLVHAYSEYGEGDFYSVKRVVELGNQNWQVVALIGTDTMPSEGKYADEGTYRFSVVSGLLSITEMTDSEGSAHASGFFRCGDVLDGMYEDPRDTAQQPIALAETYIQQGADSAADMAAAAAEKFEGDWSYRNGCDRGHFVTLYIERKQGRLVGSWSDGTLLRGSQGQLRGRMDDERLVLRLCTDGDEEAGGPPECPNFELTHEYLVAKDGKLTWYQAYGPLPTAYVVLTKVDEAHHNTATCEADQPGDDQ